MSALGAFTAFHVLVSLIEIVAGIAMFRRYLGGHDAGSVAGVFVWSTALNLITGFLFPFNGVTPAIVIGIINVIILIPVVIIWAKRRAASMSSKLFMFASLALLYFDCLVLIVQSFQKVPPLHNLAPVGNEPAVIISQTILLVLGLVLTAACIRSVRRAA